MVRNPEGWWINTECFREEAKHFAKNGYYTSAPWGSPDWKAYWDEQLKRTQEGYTVGGVRITGDHYFYLNFSQIRVTKEDPVTKRKRKMKFFPDFWDTDYNFFHFVEIARYGISEENLKKLQLDLNPLLLDGGHHLIVGKARRKGFSFKNAAILANRYNNTRGFKSLIGAYDKKYSINGTMKMVLDDINFLDENTAWAKKRDEINRKDAIKASFYSEVGGIGTYKGYKSEISALTFKDNPDAPRGNDFDYVILEEIGAWPDSKSALSSLRPCVEDGDYVTGLIVCYGTGGDLDRGTRDFSEMFYDPETFNFLPFENIWDTEAAFGDRCGYFVPTTVSRPGKIDEAGNSLVEEAKQTELEKRAKILEGRSGTQVLRGHVQENPLEPSESFMSSGANDFPVKELTQQLGKVRTQGLASALGQVCHIRRSETGVELVPDLKKELNPITRFPLKSEDIGIVGMEGALVVWEFPVKNAPRGLYKIGYDPYRQDQSEGPSLGAIYVYKAANMFSYTSNMLVAEYVGRPDSMDDCHRIAEMLAEAYGSEIMHENEIKDVVSYFRRIRKLHLLAKQPDAVISASVKNSTVSRTYGIHMTAGIKDSVEKYIKQWLLEERDTDEDGNKVLNLHRIYSPALLEELIKFNRKKGNFDRIMALGMCLIQQREEEEGKNHKKDHQISALTELQDLIKNKHARSTF